MSITAHSYLFYVELQEFLYPLKMFFYSGTYKVLICKQWWFLLLIISNKNHNKHCESTHDSQCLFVLIKCHIISLWHIKGLFSSLILYFFLFLFPFHLVFFQPSLVHLTSLSPPMELLLKLPLKTQSSLSQHSGMCTTMPLTTLLTGKTARRKRSVHLFVFNLILRCSVNWLPVVETAAPTTL